MPALLHYDNQHALACVKRSGAHVLDKARGGIGGNDMLILNKSGGKAIILRKAPGVRRRYI